MKLLKELTLAGALTLASFITMPGAFAHEIKLGDLEIIHPLGAAVAHGGRCDGRLHGDPQHRQDR